MSIFDLLLIFLVLASVVGIVGALVELLFRRRALAARSLLAIAVAWAIYLGVGTAIAVMTPQHIVSIGEDRCFDELCFAVMGYNRTPSTNPGKSFYIVDVRISSRSRGRAQREIGRKGILIDRAGHVYEASREGMQALFPVQHAPYRGLDAEVSPGQLSRQSLCSNCPMMSAARVLRWAATWPSIRRAS